MDFMATRLVSDIPTCISRIIHFRCIIPPVHGGLIQATGTLARLAPEDITTMRRDLSMGPPHVEPVAAVITASTREDHPKVNVQHVRQESTLMKALPAWTTRRAKVV